MWSCWAGAVRAQEAPAPPAGPPPVQTQPTPAQSIGGFPALLPTVSGRAADQPPAISSFIESLGSTEAFFEVKVGQGRLMTLKENLAAPGKPSPSIAIGDPTVIDTLIVGPRQIRVIGKRIGTTDL